DVFDRVGGASGPAGTGNRLLGNSIHDNTSNGLTPNRGLGIDLIGNGPTPNDPCDTDTGPNHLQNFPVLTGASSVGGSTSIQGTLTSNPNRPFRIEFFSSPACDPTGFGEGQTLLGSVDVSTDGTCNATINATLPVSAGPGVVTATATDLTTGDTSEFSACQALGGAGASFFTVSPCRVADTRNPNGPYGGPALAANADRTFVIGGQCAIPSTPTRGSFHFTITQPTAAGDLRGFPAGRGLPLV